METLDRPMPFPSVALRCSPVTLSQLHLRVLACQPQRQCCTEDLLQPVEDILQHVTTQYTS
ncbi:hypothetical protein EYF80_011536 [Liparis tanakae]|uniref:Uncharacterized protein n=1 Tax=Liparis tanakae TaxID=230148 RepID=A0A4Z2IK97_9TELE|nr:hypothetical protein EYF80_011536 [Liparis tanakae]